MGERPAAFGPRPSPQNRTGLFREWAPAPEVCEIDGPSLRGEG
jgi:hypothetical protein